MHKAFQVRFEYEFAIMMQFWRSAGGRKEDFEIVKTQAMPRREHKKISNSLNCLEVEDWKSNLGKLWSTNMFKAELS